MTGPEKTKLLNDALKLCWFPYGSGDELFDVVEKRKARLLKIVYEECEPGGNPCHQRSLYITIQYSGENKIRKISHDTLHRRFLPITQLLGMWDEFEKYQDSWVGDFISSPRTGGHKVV